MIEEVDLEYTLNIFKKIFKSRYRYFKGVTKDKAVKVFRGNLVFEEDIRKAKSEGSESEFSIILDKSGKCSFYPNLDFCDEDDVMGAHSASIGKVIMINCFI